MKIVFLLTFLISSAAFTAPISDYIVRGKVRGFSTKMVSLLIDGKIFLVSRKLVPSKTKLAWNKELTLYLSYTELLSLKPKTNPRKKKR